MAYDDRFIVDHTPYGNYDFGADADEIVAFRGPPGFRGKLLNVGVGVTEEFACASTTAKVQVGTADDPDAYAQLEIADETADADFFDVSDDTDCILDADIPADTLVQVKMIQATDNSADAGQGVPHVTIEWYKE